MNQTETLEPDTVEPIEAAHVFEARIAAELAAAEAEAEAARAAELAAFVRVDRARGDHALNLIAKGQLLIAQRALCAAQEATAVADSKVRAVEREIVRQRAGRAAVERAVAIGERDVQAELARHSRERASELWAHVFGCLEELNRLPGLPPLSSAGRAHDQALGALSQLRRLFS